MSCVARRFALLAMSGISLFLNGCSMFSARPLALEKTPPLKPVSPNLFRNVNPRFSHDGKRIAFVRTYPNRTQAVFTTDANDTDFQRGHQETEPEIVCPDRPYAPDRLPGSEPDTLVWTPDDRQLIFTRAVWFDFGKRENFPGTELWTLDLRTGATEPLAIHTKFYHGIFYYYKNPVMSPDGKRVAFTGEGIGGQRAIFVRNLALQEADEVEPRYDRYEDSEGAVWEPKIGAKEAASLIFRQGIRRAAYAPLTETIRRIRLGAHMGGGLGELWRLSTGTAKSLLAGQSKLSVVPRVGQLAPSSDGAKIAFVVTSDALDLSRARLWTMNRDGTDVKPMSRSGEGAFAPLWLGRETLAYLTPQAGKFEVRSINLRMGQFKTLGSTETADFDLSPDGTKLVSAQTGVRR